MKYDNVIEAPLTHKWLGVIDQCLEHQLERYQGIIELIQPTTVRKRHNGLPSFKIRYRQGHVTEYVLRMVGFSGKAGSGKDLSADIYRTIIQELIDQKTSEYGNNQHYFIHRDAFANTLKNICAVLTDTPEDKFHTIEGKCQYNTFAGMTNRKVAQLVGTECFRDIFDADIWVRTTINNFIRELLRDYYMTALSFNNQVDHQAICIISDVRFENEANMFRALRGDLAMVLNDSHEIDAEVNTHRSEHLFDIDPDDIVIRNGGKCQKQLTDAIFDAFIMHGNRPDS